MKITILCDNTAPASLGILGEHGFAALIENKSASYLFDTGQGHTLLHNARCLRKNLEKITAVFLSHGHYDHTGGLKSIAEIKKEIEVWAHPEVFLKRFARHEKNGRLILRPVGIPYSKRYYEARGVHFSYATSVHEVSSHMYVLYR
jgi:7,8-dihydropterin-6-yl-methyl-4-(beta-D-ribofuranosyl)aminobenzene 5'-phosphate synthase